MVAASLVPRHPLDGPRLKIRRAREQIEALRRADAAFGDETEYELVRAELNRKTGAYVYRVRLGAPPPPEWGVWIGEIAHNLRSALDQLVYQLALLTTKTPERRIQFPVLLIRPKGTGRRPLRDLRPEHEARIVRLQPYRPGGRGQQNLLYLLQEINNADKHRLIQVVGAKAGVFGFGSFVDPAAAEDDSELLVKQPRRRRRVAVLKEGAKILEAASHVVVNPRLVPLVAFAEGCSAVQGWGVCNLLSQIARHTSEIVESFGSEFPS